MRTPSGNGSWAVVGGGMLGLTLAHRLSQAGAEVVVYEEAPAVGGLAGAWRLGDVVWDRHYHVTLLSDVHTRRLFTELGLEQEMQWVRTRTGFYGDGRLSSISSALDYLMLPFLDLPDKLRLAGTIFYASRIHDWRRLEAKPVETWLRQLSGDRTFEKLWVPLLRAKLGDNYGRASAAFIWASIARLYAARRTGLKTEMLGYVPGGYARVLERFGQLLPSQRVSLRTGARVRRVLSAGEGLEVELADGARERHGVVVVTPPSPVAGRICESLTLEERARLDGSGYQGVVCASALLTRPLGGYYLTYLTDDWVPFTAVVEMTAMVPPRDLGGYTLVYLPKYVAGGDPLLDAPADQIRESFLQGLERIFPSLRRAEVAAFEVSRVRHVFPVPIMHFSQRTPCMHTSTPGLHVVNSGQIVNGTLNVNETVRHAENAAREILRAPRGGGRPCC